MTLKRRLARQQSRSSGRGSVELTMLANVLRHGKLSDEDGILLSTTGQVVSVADAKAIICDRLVHNAHLLKLGGPSMRRKKALETQPQPA